MTEQGGIKLWRSASGCEPLWQDLVYILPVDLIGSTELDVGRRIELCHEPKRQLVTEIARQRSLVEDMLGETKCRQEQSTQR